MLLAAGAIQPDARDSRHEFVNMLVSDGCDSLLVDPRHVAGVLDQRLLATLAGDDYLVDLVDLVREREYGVHYGRERQ